MMMTLKELADAHGLFPKSLGIYLGKAGIKPLAFAQDWPHAGLYDQEAAAAVAVLLQTSPRSRKRGRPRKPKALTEETSNEIPCK